jgi:DNA replication protein DnaC
MNRLNINQEELWSLLENTELWPKAGLDPNKGLFLNGNPGVGKTFNLTKYLSVRKKGWSMSAYDIESEVQLKGPSVINNYVNHDMMIDDLGMENDFTMHYGAKLRPLQNLLFVRHKVFPTYKTHITTNLTIADLRLKYTERIVDRLFEMCNIITVEGHSKRI